jgi:DNA-binding CsgD family transcriptional regulator
VEQRWPPRENQVVIEAAEVVIGREEELGVLRDFLARQRGAIVVEGEAGIGKTMLLDVVVNEATASGRTVLRASQAESEAEISFAALADLLSGIDEALDVLPPPQSRALAVALRRAEPDDPTGEPLDRGAVAFAFVSVLRALAAANPVVVAVDDVQWLDVASASALSFAARRVGEHQVAWLLSGRTTDDAELPLGLGRASARERVEILRLGPLSLGALHRILHRRLGKSFARPTLRRLHELSQGNPFYALEVGRALLRRPVLPGEGLPVPGQLHELLHDRLAVLSRATLEVVQIAAALSRPTASVLEALADRASIADAVDADVLRISDGRVIFTHPLLASAAYAMLETTEMRQLHTRLAVVVDDPEERARHLARSTTEPDATVAAALDAAAEEARLRGAPAEAAELLEHARRLTPSDRDDDLLRRKSHAAANYFDAGDAATARTLFEQVAAAAPAGQPRAEALTRLARVCGYGADLPMAADLYRRAIREAAEDPVTRGEAEGGLAVAMLRMVKDLPSAAAHAREAAALAKGQGDASRSAEYLAAQALIETMLAEPGADAIMAEAVAAARPVSAPSAVVGAQLLPVLWGGEFARGVVFALTDDLADARQLLETLQAEALGAGDESSLPLILRYLSAVELGLGDWQAAERTAAEGYDIALQTGQLSQEAVLAGSVALVAAHLGQIDAARSAAERALELEQATGARFGRMLGLSALACLELSLHHPDEVVRMLLPLLDELEAAGVREPTLTSFVPDLVEALIELDRSDEALDLLAVFEERAARLDRVSALAAAARCRGIHLAILRDVDGAAFEFERALAEHDRFEMPFERARTLLARGAAQRRANQRRAARDSLGEALEIFDRLGARLWADRTRGELARIAGRAPSPDALTTTEQRVAALVAAGRTNNEVAAELYVSVHTVEKALTRIYGKLGVRSRTELARKLSAKE